MNGLIAWFAKNGVAANLLMISILVLGLHAATTRIPLEVFPEFELEIINVTIPFRGATPTDVERSVVLRVEEAIHDLEGVKELRATASEGRASITLELHSGTDERAMLDDVKARVDAISTFPSDVERPIYSIPTRRREVIALVLSGDVGERALRQFGERVRDELSAIPGITQVVLDTVRAYEIAIEVSENALHRYGLTFDDVADAVRRGSLDLPAGSIKAAGGEILLRTNAQAYGEADFQSLVVLTRSDGTRLTLGDIAEVRDGFEENPIRSQFNGKPAVLVEVYRVGDQNAIAVADAVKAYMEIAQSKLPPGVSIEYWRDRSRIVKSRLATLARSAWQGGVLIFILLALFLRFSVAAWVCVGIPVSFMGALAVMPELGVTINIISLFAFILVLGVVVDDAIVTGENIYTRMREQAQGPAYDSTSAAITGAQEVAMPVTFGILTTIAAFVPLLLIEGARGQIFAQIPLIVIPVLVFSWVESKLILPAHLRHLRIDRTENWLVRSQQRIAEGLEQFIIRYYQPLLTAALRQRYLTLALFLGGAVVLIGFVMGGKINFIFFPRVQSEVARASLTMPPGTPIEVTERHVERITAAAESLRKRHIDPDSGVSVIKGVHSVIGSGGGGGAAASHVGRVLFEIVSPENRTLEITSSELVRSWRQAIGTIPGAESLTFRAEIGRGGAPLAIRLSSNNTSELGALSGVLKQRLRTYPHVFDVEDTFERGKQELRITIKPEGQLLGVDVRALARQVRQAFFGEEAQRIQRGRDDVRVMVRYPENERSSLAALSAMRIRTADGSEVPFTEVAHAELGRGFSVIRRIGRERVIDVTADYNKERADPEAIKRDLQEFLDQVGSEYPNVRTSLEGEAREQRESFGSLGAGLVFVLFVIYGLLAIPFKSYGQPLIVMSVIPFGVMGAILGHMLLGMNLSILSYMGMLALIGVVVNDSLVLVDFVNRRRREGRSTMEASRMAGVARFRAVMLTSATTFAGLMPLIFERSTQAQFLIPMAVSLGFGILFATAITLILVPINYVILEDLKRLPARLFGQRAPPAAPANSD